jgi:excisionase family DNA binding protein
MWSVPPAVLSPEQAAERLGVSSQHVRRLIAVGELEAECLPNSRGWQLPFRSILAFEERRHAARGVSDQAARNLDRLGAPLE